jgi:hypothetical protein
MRHSITRAGQQARPSLEGLEGRRLLSSAPGSAQADIHSLTAPGVVHQFDYTTPQGSRVDIRLFGLGNLAGTTVDPDGGLNLVFSGTNAATAIIGHVSGGTGQAPLRSFYNADVPPLNLTGIGGSPLAQVHLQDFNLVSGGEVNLTAGVDTLILNSAASNSQIHLRYLPQSFSSTTSTSMSATANGVTTQYSIGKDGSLTLSSVSGQFTPGLNLQAPRSNTTTVPSSATATGSTTLTIPISSSAAPPAPPGIILNINHIQGIRNTVGLEDPEVFGYDPTQSALIRFDATTGAEIGTPIPVSGLGTAAAGVALGRNNGSLVVLVGNGTTIDAFDAVSGAPVGSFSTANLSSLGLNTITGIGSTDDKTVVSDATAPPGGTLLRIDVTASLASPTHQAVPIGSPFSPTRQFQLSGDLTGVAASNTIYAPGAAHFDSFQPDLFQAGLLSVSTGGGKLGESARTALTSQGAEIDISPPGSNLISPPQAFGSVDQNLALVTGVANGQNTVTLLSAATLSNAGTTTLNDPNLLSGLSESFRPDLVGSALIDIQGNVQSVRALDANGLVLNDAGNLNLVKAAQMSNSVVIGMPLGHVQMPNRSNVTLLSTARIFADRGGVTVVPHLKQVGPLSLPS